MGHITNEIVAVESDSRKDEISRLIRNYIMERIQGKDIALEEVSLTKIADIITLKFSLRAFDTTFTVSSTKEWRESELFAEYKPITFLIEQELQKLIKAL